MSLMCEFGWISWIYEFILLIESVKYTAIIYSSIFLFSSFSFWNFNDMYVRPLGNCSTVHLVFCWFCSVLFLSVFHFLFVLFLWLQFTFSSAMLTWPLILLRISFPSRIIVLCQQVLFVSSSYLFPWFYLNFEHIYIKLLF